ncbi:MAG: response regulator [Deltaproteobacteria bacterium]|nr:response regulator [Deltaproteobacteria bacterium]
MHTILVADDSVTIQRAVEIAFDKEPFTVLKASNAGEAFARALELRPHLVLADHTMPDRSGYDLAAALRADPTTQAIPVVLLTAASAPFDTARAQSAGVAVHVQKPFDCQTLLERVRGVLGVSAPAPGAAAPAPAPTAAPASAATTDMPRPPGIPGVLAAPSISSSMGATLAAAAAAAPRTPAAPAPRPSTLPAPAPAPTSAAFAPTLAPAAPSAALAAPAPAPAPATSSWQSIPTGSAFGASRTDDVIELADADFGDIAAALPVAVPPPAPPAGDTDFSEFAATVAAPPAPAAPAAAAPAWAAPAALAAAPAAPPQPAPPAAAAAAVTAAVVAQAAPAIAAVTGAAPSAAVLTAEARAIVEKIAWEVVPELAEVIIREEIQRLLKARPGG